MLVQRFALDYRYIFLLRLLLFFCFSSGFDLKKSPTILNKSMLGDDSKIDIVKHL